MSITTPSDETLRIVRRAYAKQMLALAGVSDDLQLENAFASVPREQFVGHPPWKVVGQGGYRPFPSEDPVSIYQDVNIALAAERGVNNGSPSLHARWLHAAALREGSHVAHIGAGSGYYTAVIAQMVGNSGRVTAVEIDPVLADRARQNLSHFGNVTIIEGDGAQWPKEPADIVYVNFAASRPADAWIENLNLDGRLIFPLGVPRPSQTPSGGFHTLYGSGFCIQHRDNGYAASCLGPASFVCAEGSLSTLDSERLSSAFRVGGIEFVRSLRWKAQCSPLRSWFIGSDWSLCYDELSGLGP